MGFPSQATPRITAITSSSKKGMKGTLHQNLQKAPILRTPGFLTSGCQNWEKTIWFEAIPFVILYYSSARKQVSTIVPIVPEQLLTAALFILGEKKKKKDVRIWGVESRKKEKPRGGKCGMGRGRESIAGVLLCGRNGARAQQVLASCGHGAKRMLAMLGARTHFS